jgi:hypothetical protein
MGRARREDGPVERRPERTRLPRPARGAPTPGSRSSPAHLESRPRRW